MAFVPGLPSSWQGRGLRRAGNPEPSRRRRAPATRRRSRCVMTQTNPEELSLQIFTVPPGAELLTPGEVRAIQMTYSTFHQILSAGSTLFAQVYASEWARARGETRPRGSLLTIQSVRKVSTGDELPAGAEAPSAALPPAPPVVTAEVRCTGRADVLGGAEPDAPGELPADPAPWTVLRGTARQVRDQRATSIDDRLAIAHAEWDAWMLCGELEDLRRRLGKQSADEPFVDAWAGVVGNKGGVSGRVPLDDIATLRVWAPRDYDREIQEYEWNATPVEVRDLWQARAEALSFAILRHVRADDECMRQAMSLTSTSDRLVLGRERIVEEKALTVAKLTLKGALGGQEPSSDDAK